jgi:hypothetical protein
MPGRKGTPSAIGACLASVLTAASACAEADPGFAWMADEFEGNASLVYGSTETGEDYVFSLSCRRKEAYTTLYVDIPGTKVGQPITIEFAAGTAKFSLQGKIATDEMSGFHFAEAKNFKIKPVIALLKERGPVTAKTGKLVSSLPEKGRFAAVSAFAGTCKLD